MHGPAPAIVINSAPSSSSRFQLPDYYYFNRGPPLGSGGGGAGARRNSSAAPGKRRDESREREGLSSQNWL